MYLSAVHDGGGTFFPLARPAREHQPQQAAGTASGERSSRGGGGGSVGGEGGRPPVELISVAALRRSAALSEALRAIYTGSDGGAILPAPAGCAAASASATRPSPPP